jgi:3-oxoacyl-(acyl-carrier-protein) synthase
MASTILARKLEEQKIDLGPNPKFPSQTLYQITKGYTWTTLEAADAVELQSQLQVLEDMGWEVFEILNS